LQKFHEIVRFSGRYLATLAVLAVFAGCTEPVDSAEESADSEAIEPPAVMSALPAPAAAASCREDGHLQTRLFGALEGTLDWSGAAMECSGMPRPDSAGARLRFAGQAGDRHIAIIVALPGLMRDGTGTELSSKVTLIDESSGRFFSTADLDTCWTDIRSAKATGDAGDQLDISGILYCVAPLAEVNGTGSISISELSFAGSLDWNAK
jgi:hypothetical protein